MWRGPVIQARKNAVNAVKGKIFSTHAKLISMAAQSGGNPDDNPTLATAIYKAKKEGVPNDNIDRAIKKWTGEDKSAAQIVEIVYEWYGPGWVAIIISTLTDNKNRTVSSIRAIFAKCGGNLWESWAVAWMFHKKWVIFIDPAHHDYDTIEELVFETDAEDIKMESGYIKILTALEDFQTVETFFEEKKITMMETKVDYVPDNEIEVDDFDKALKLIKMIEAFDEDEDVASVSSNEIISDELSEKVDVFIEKNTFKS